MFRSSCLFLIIALVTGWLTATLYGSEAVLKRLRTYPLRAVQEEMRFRQANAIAAIAQAEGNRSSRTTPVVTLSDAEITSTARRMLDSLAGPMRLQAAGAQVDHEIGRAEAELQRARSLANDGELTAAQEHTLEAGRAASQAQNGSEQLFERVSAALPGQEQLGRMLAPYTSDPLDLSAKLLADTQGFLDDAKATQQAPAETTIRDAKTLFEEIQRLIGKDKLLAGTILVRDNYLSSAQFELRLKGKSHPNTQSLVMNVGAGGKITATPADDTLNTTSTYTGIFLAAGASLEDDTVPGKGTKEKVYFGGVGYRFKEWLSVSGGAASLAGQVDPYVGISFSIGHIFGLLRPTNIKE
jgi:hypothetical protein